MDSTGSIGNERARSPRSKKEKLQAILKLAKKLGAEEVKLISTKELVFDPRVRLKCLVPMCPHYNFNLVCPPNIPSVEEFKEMIGRYSLAMIVKLSVPRNNGNSESSNADTETARVDGAKRLHLIMNQLENEAQQRGFPWAAAFMGGPCRLCEECVGYYSGRTCRHPYKARPSLEAIGIDVFTTVTNVGIEIYFPVKSYISWIGLLLIN